MPIIAKEIQVDDTVKIGGKDSLILIGEPCVIENRDHSLFMAEKIKEACRRANVPFIFKASYDKANRSSLKSYRGPGLDKGLEILAAIKTNLDVPVLSDVHQPDQVKPASEVLDVIQIPAFLCRQTDLILAAAKSHKPLNLKKGQFLSPHDMKHVIDKARSVGNQDLILTERGTSFGYNDLIMDIRSVPIMKQWGYPVVVDASHAVQKPGGMGDFSGGSAEHIPVIAKAGLCAGADGIFLEIHDHPPDALSDSYNSLILKDLYGLLHSLQTLKEALAQDNA